MSRQESGSDSQSLMNCYSLSTPYPHLFVGRGAVSPTSSGTIFSLDPSYVDKFGYDAIEKFLRNRKKRDSEFTPSDCLEETFEAEMRNCSIVSFDIFDTLLVRYVDSPFDVYQYLGREQVFRDCGLPVERLAMLRAEAEWSARAKLAHQVGMDEISLIDIYTYFCLQHRIPMNKVIEMVAAEERVDLKICKVNPPLRALYERAVQANKRIIYISDMYHRPEFLKTLLEHNGYHVPEGAVFVSSEHRYNKVSGRLFKIVFDALKISPEQMLHVGDNPRGDHATPKALGVRTILHEHRTSAESPNLANLRAPFDLQAYLSGMRRVAKVDYPNRDFWWNLGYGIFGPMTVAYCQWLEERFRQDKIECAYFFLRDMEIVSEVFERLFPQDKRAFKTKKLLSSRRAFLFPATEYIPEIALGEFGLFASTIPKPAREFLRRLCVNPKEFENEFAVANFSSPDETVLPGKLVKLFDLFRQEKVMRAVLERSRAERLLLVKYLKQEGFFDHTQVGVVEIGWGGRVQKAMQALLNQMQSPVSMHGYYLATFDVFLQNNVPNMKHSSFLVHDGQPVDWMRAILNGLRILENVYTSSNGTLLYFQESGGSVSPVFAGSGLSDQQVQMLNNIHGGIRQFATDFVSKQDSFQFENIPAVMAIEPFLRLALQPSPEEAHVIGELAYTDNFGSNGARKIAGFRPESQTIPDLWKDFEDAPWKQGLINQNNERAQALRSVLWKMDRGVS